MSAPRFSLVVPFFDEEAAIGRWWAATAPVLEALDGPWEAILVDDGSTDGTGRWLAEAAARDVRVRVMSFGTNRGQAAALLAGMSEARGEIVLTMDGDGQNDPRDFAALLSRLEGAGADLVCGWRRERCDPAVRRVMSRIANGVRRRVLRDGVHDAGCQLRVFRRTVVEAVEPMGLAQAFLPAMAVARGFRVTECPVRHHPRSGGVSKYGGARLWWRPAVEMVRLWWRLRRRA
jgi:glycosyltransferase involved in cell wall biosynthesis